MSRLLITTVGTSLLTNRDARPWSVWNGRDGDPLPDADSVDRWLAAADPVRASAETNTLQSIGVCSADRMRLLHSDTPEGRFCSERLQHFYTAVVRCRHVDARPLTALGYAHAKSQKGLRALVDEAITAVRDAHEASLEPVFCATGGFKAEIAFLNLMGALLQVEVYYIHERFRDIVRLPRLPLVWDADWVLQRRKFFEWIDEEPRRSPAVASHLKADPGLLPLIDDDPDGHSYLNAAGNLLFRVAKERGPRAVWPPAAATPPGDKNGLSGVEHHRSRGWQAFVQRLCDVDCVSRVSYDPAAFGGDVVKVLDGPKGVIAVRYGPAGDELPVRVETTARGDAQTDMVRKYVADEIL